MPEDGLGKIDSREKASLITIRNKNGMEAAVTDYGAALVSLLVPDREGRLRDVVLGHENAADYEREGYYFGATVGRIANRIAGGTMEIDGGIFELEQNDGENCLHGGRNFYNKRFWAVSEEEEDYVTFHLTSLHMDQGFPGTIDIDVTYQLTEDDRLVIFYDVYAEADSCAGLTNHSYFNLNGHDSGAILDHVVRINADHYLPTDETLIPTGELKPVEGTPFDFRTEKPIGRDIGAADPDLELAGGYDQNWCLRDTEDDEVRFAASVYAPESGIGMEVWTDLPGMQMYTANFLKNVPGKDGARYQKWGGVCFETQYYPDAVHHEEWKQPLIEAGEQQSSRTEYRFFVK